MIPPDYSGWIIIDEVQRIPELLNEVHDLIESQKHIFILTVSSARKLRQKGVNLPAGRALTYHLHPLTAKEQENAWQISQSLRYGHLPARFSEHDPQKYLKDYPPARCYLFYGGSTPLYIDDITVLPIEQALRNLNQLLRPS